MAKFKVAIKNATIFYEVDDARTAEEAESIAIGIFADDMEEGEFIGMLEVDPDIPLEAEATEISKSDED